MAERKGPFCGAVLRRGKEGTCRRAPGAGTEHLGFGRCSWHGGCSPSGAKSASTAAAEAAVVTYGLPRDISPADALLEEVRYAAGHVAWLREKVRELEDRDLIWGVTEEVSKTATEFAGTDTTSAATANMWLELYYRERKHLVDVTKSAISAGIEERRVKLAEDQGALLVKVIRGILGDLDLSVEQESKVAAVVPRHLRAVG